MSVFDAMQASADATQLATYGDPITYTPTGGSAVVITGIKIPPTQLEGIIPGQNLGLWVRLSDLPVQPKRADTLVLNSATYDVVEVHNDTVGGCYLAISKS
jgi:hypothetical protein